MGTTDMYGFPFMAETAGMTPVLTGRLSKAVEFAVTWSARSGDEYRVSHAHGDGTPCLIATYRNGVEV